MCIHLHLWQLVHCYAKATQKLHTIYITIYNCIVTDLYGLIFVLYLLSLQSPTSFECADSHSNITCTHVRTQLWGGHPFPGVPQQLCLCSSYLMHYAYICIRMSRVHMFFGKCWILLWFMHYACMYVHTCVATHMLLSVECCVVIWLQV